MEKLKVPSHPLPKDMSNRRDAKVHFDDLIIEVAGAIFAESLGQKVAQVLMHNFISRDPSRSDVNVDRAAILRNLLAESFGDFYVKILQIILEKVCSMADIHYDEFRDRPIPELLEEAEKAFHLKKSKDTTAA